MILTAHILVGAAAASKLDHAGVIFIAALASHYVLDIIPHWEPYFREGNPAQGLENLRDPKVSKTVLKIAFDFFSGLALVGILQVITDAPALPIFLGALSATIPDFLSFLHFRNYPPRRLLALHDQFNDFIHMPTKKIRSKTIGIATTIAISLCAIAVISSAVI